ncbi:hypothetical protein FHL15_011071 [Xylaria flabelliformis]|uniref:Zn(2)-C6 fungal-type domain-containing protein n=1 Tax=Xylaria flabelliformis TaxID=2512241 RepID=A0A553HJ87_9PEZI|nr:hypothetical protein FHL15_011071 [Xylaria flabelliformis]
MDTINGEGFLDHAWAQGVFKKIRHKKCDESRPACVRCSSTGRRCDFSQEHHLQDDPSPIQSIQSIPVLLLLRHPAPNLDLTSRFESIQSLEFEFFTLICAPEYGIFFETPFWESLVLQSAVREPCIYHAALAISTLTRNHYFPTSHWYDPTTGARSAAGYSMMQYNLAIRYLNARLSSSVPNRNLTKLTVLTAIVFINLEFLCQDQVSSSRGSWIAMHLRGATCLLRDLKSRFGAQPDLDSEYLESGVAYLRRQAEQFMIRDGLQ